MGTSEWSELADRIDMRMLAAVTDAIHTCGMTAKKTLVVVLGILPKEYKGFYDFCSAHRFSELAADCARVITNIDNITNADL